MKTKLKFKTMPKDYSKLLALHMLRPLHDKVDYKNALEVLDALAGQRLNADQDDYFEALSLIVEAYESAHLPTLPAVTGVSLLKHLLEENQMSAADLAKVLGVDRSLGVRILNGERNLTLEHIKKLKERFHLPVEVFFE